MEIILKSIRVSGESKKTYTLTLLAMGEERKYIIDEGTYREIGCPLSELSLTSVAYETIVRCDARLRCLKRALRMLEYSDKSENALRAKLRALGYTAQAVDFAISECKSHSYLNEQRTLEALVERFANRELLGPYRIIARLATRGYRGTEVKRVMSELIARGDIDLDENKTVLLSKHCAEADSEAAQKLLHKYGYIR